MRYRVAHRRAAAQSGLTQVLGLMEEFREPLVSSRYLCQLVY